MRRQIRHLRSIAVAIAASLAFAATTVATVLADSGGGPFPK